MHFRRACPILEQCFCEAVINKKCTTLILRIVKTQKVRHKFQVPYCQIMLLADLRRPIASLTLTGSLLAIIAIVTSSLGHTWYLLDFLYWCISYIARLVSLQVNSGGVHCIPNSSTECGAVFNQPVHTAGRVSLMICKISYILSYSGGTRERATMTQTTISDWQHQLCDVYSTTSKNHLNK